MKFFVGDTVRLKPEMVRAFDDMECYWHKAIIGRDLHIIDSLQFHSGESDTVSYILLCSESPFSLHEDWLELVSRQEPVGWHNTSGIVEPWGW